MNALIVCHAGSGIGLGHLSRCLVVARALYQTLGMNVHLLIQGEQIQNSDLSNFEYQFLEQKEDLLNEIRKRVKHIDIQIVVLDLYPRLVPEDIGDFLEELRGSNRKIISVDGLVDYRNILDLIFIPSFRFSFPDNLTGATPILFGWDCLLLNVNQSPPKWKNGHRVLALSGGCDATGLGKTLPNNLDNTLSTSTELHWVTGPYAEAPVFPDSPRLQILNHQSPSGLDDLMLETNFAITVFGVSFFELLYYGIPTVVFSPYGDRDDAELDAIAEEGVALVARGEVDAVSKMKELMADDSLAASLSERSRQKMSVLGDQKFAGAVRELMART